MNKQKYYVVWKGRRSGIYKSWEACSAQVSGFAGAQFKSFDSLAEAEKAFRSAYSSVKGKPKKLDNWKMALTKPRTPSISVDAACSGVPGPVEWRGVETDNGKELFKFGPYTDGTNNIGEFLAIVQGLEWMKVKNINWPLYSDSKIAISWVKAKKCRTKLAGTGKNDELFALINRAETWLAENNSVVENIKILKWDTEMWGENPADFGRK